MSLKDIKNTREVHTVSFGKRTQKTSLKPEGAAEHDAWATYGYIPDQGDIPLEYLVRISSFRYKATVVGVIQEDVATSVESQWDYIVDPGKISQGDYITQAVTGSKSLITKATSRRKWTTTTPMTLSLKLKFEAINNAEHDVVSAMRVLQKMACPAESASGNNRSGERGTLDMLPLLSPPGPTPFTLKGLLGSEVKKDYTGVSNDYLRGGDMIMVEIGRLMTFHNVVATRVDSIHENKYDSNGNCISGIVNFTFQTYEMATSNFIDTAYEKHTPRTTQGE